MTHHRKESEISRDRDFKGVGLPPRMKMMERPKPQLSRRYSCAVLCGLCCAVWGVLWGVLCCALLCCALLCCAVWGVLCCAALCGV